MAAAATKRGPMFTQHTGPTSTVSSFSGRHRIHTTFSDRVEMIEEYSIETGALMTRKWKAPGTLGGTSGWQVEIDDRETVPGLGKAVPGAPAAAAAASAATSRPAAAGAAPATLLQAATPTARESLVIKASSSAPKVYWVDHPRHWEVRISPLPYPRSVYQLSVDAERQQLVLRTSNKKYFKRLDLAGLSRLNIPLDERALGLEWKDRTLSIKYAKPAEVMAAELAARKRVVEVAKKHGGVGVDCAQQ